MKILLQMLSYINFSLKSITKHFSLIYELSRFLPNVLHLSVMIVRRVWFRSYNLRHAQGVSVTQHYSVFSRVQCRPHTVDGIIHLSHYYPQWILLQMRHHGGLNSQSRGPQHSCYKILISAPHLPLLKHLDTQTLHSAFLSVGIGSNQGVLIVWLWADNERD